MSCQLFPFLPLRKGRVHEVCGSSSAVFAAIAAASAGGVALWVREAWLPEMLNPLGLLPFLDPANLLVARPRDQTDALAVMEEALKDSSVPFVVIEITRPLNLREGRRLQLAAKVGNTTGLCIMRDGMGSNAAETRWRVAPHLDPTKEDSTSMRWEIIKNKSGTLGAWNVCWNAQTHHLYVVPPVGERPGSACTPD